MENTLTPDLAFLGCRIPLEFFDTSSLYTSCGERLRAVPLLPPCEAPPPVEDWQPKTCWHFHFQLLKTAGEWRRGSDTTSGSCELPVSDWKAIIVDVGVTSTSSLLQMLLSSFKLLTWEIPQPRKRCWPERRGRAHTHTHTHILMGCVSTQKCAHTHTVNVVTKPCTSFNEKENAVIFLSNNIESYFNPYIFNSRPPYILN